MIESLSKQIPLISNCKEIIQITKGYSFDEKFLIYLQDENEKVLLRLFDLEDFESKKNEYSILGVMKNYNIICSKPLSFGVLENRGYMITSYIEGKDAGEEIPKYSYQEPYNIGVEAAKELKKMHTLPY